MKIAHSIEAQIRTEDIQMHTLELSIRPQRIRLMAGLCALAILTFLGMFHIAALLLTLNILIESFQWYIHRNHSSAISEGPIWKILLFWLSGFTNTFIYMAMTISFSLHADVAVITLSIMWICGTFLYIANTYSRLPFFAFFLLIPVIISGFIVIYLIHQTPFDNPGPGNWPLMFIGLCVFGSLVVENVIRQKKSNNDLESALDFTKQQFEELQSVKKQLLDAVEGMDSGFALYDQDQRLVMHNACFVDMYSGLSDLIKPGIKHNALIDAMFERRLLLAPDKALPLLEQDSPTDNIDITMANGALYNMRFNFTAHGNRVSLVTDITNAVQGQQKLRAMFDVSADAMFDCDLIHGTITFDTGFKTQFGHDWIGDHTLPSVWNTVLHPDDADRVHQHIDRFINSQQVRLDIAFRMQCADGRWAQVSQRTVALRDDTGKAVSMIGAVADLTDRHQLEDQLRTAQKMEAMGRISGGIAHDFNNLLAVIMGNAEYLQLNDHNTDIQGCMDEIVSATKRGAELTRRLLSFARRSRLAPQCIAPSEMIDNMGQLFLRVLPASIKLTTSTQQDTWPIKVDPAFLESSLLNLVINARDAMPDGGIINIETSNQLIYDKYSLQHNESLPAGRYVMITVTDTGLGIPENILERVIEPFFTTKGPTHGSGMGLSMVDGFVRQSGGLMRIESEPDEGTTIRFLLPADTDEPKLPAEHSFNEPTLSLNKNLQILMVEDDPHVRDIVARILKEAGLDILQAESGDAALALYERLPQLPDVLLTDVVMPGSLQGPELARKLRERQPNLQIIFMSGYASESAINGNNLRADDHFLMKPIQLNELLNLLASLPTLDKHSDNNGNLIEG